MNIERLVQLWHHRGTTCTMTPANHPAPYWVIITEGTQTISRRSFADHHAATVFAVDELRRATQSDSLWQQGNAVSPDG